MNKSEYSEICNLIIKFGKAAHSYGIPDGQLEVYLLKISKAFKIKGDYHCTPRYIIFAFNSDEEYWQKINLGSVKSKGFNMTKLAKLDRLVNKLISGDLSISEADKELDSFHSIKDTYGKLLTAVSYMCFGSGFAAILSGGWMDILVSGFLSLIVYFIILAANSNIGISTGSIPVVTALIAGFFSVIFKSYFPELNYVLVALSAIIILVPGYGISVGIAELVNNNVISGMGNLVTGLVYLLKQFSGAWLGFTLAVTLVDLPLNPAISIDPAWLWLFLPMMFFGLLIIFQISRQDFIWAFIGCALGYLGVVYGSEYLSSYMGNLIGATAISSYAILWERKTGRPASIVFLPAVMTLVGGSSGFQGLVATFQGDPAGHDQFMQMFYIAFTITAGLIISNAALGSREEL